MVCYESYKKFEIIDFYDKDITYIDQRNKFNCSLTIWR